MVRLLTVHNTFHARVVAARLGAEGILTELRGNVDGPYPMGIVHVFIDSDDLPVAQELLMVDEVEDALSRDDSDDEAAPAQRLWVVVAAVVLLLAVLFARHL
jgi:hypothetical protein